MTLIITGTTAANLALHMNPDLQKADEFIRSVETLAKLLRGLSMEAVATAIKEEACERQIDMYNQRRKAWGGLFVEMANDMESMITKMDAAKLDSQHMLDRYKRAISLLSSSDFKEATANLQTFVDLCERFQKLRDNGLLDKIIQTAARV